MWREPHPAASDDLTIPDVIGERCVHALMETASCRSCADACPRGAWVIDDQMLGIDGDRCDGCDLCVPACPQGAVEGRFSASLKKTDQGGVAFAACEHAGVATGRDGMMPCLHALGTADLLQLRRDGAGLIVTSRGDCEGCDRGSARRLDLRLREINRLLASRGLEPLKHRDLDADAWVEAFRRICALSDTRPLDRRAFFRSAVKVPKERVEALIQDSIHAFVPPGMLLDDGGADSLFPFVPRIDPGNCVGCDACVRLCPQQAIRLHADESDGLQFVSHAERCSGCRICTDVCSWGAVRVEPMAPGKEIRVPLQELRCPACGADFHVPAAAEESRSLCWVCRKANHHGNLYQVLD